MFPPGLSGLEHLSLIDLRKNQINNVDGIKDLKCIEINLNQNQLAKLPDSIVSCKFSSSQMLKPPTQTRVDDSSNKLKVHASKCYESKKTVSLKYHPKFWKIRRFQHFISMEIYLIKRKSRIQKVMTNIRSVTPNQSRRPNDSFLFLCLLRNHSHLVYYSRFYKINQKN